MQGSTRIRLHPLRLFRHLYHQRRSKSTPSTPTLTNEQPHQTNTTQSLAPPTTKDTKATYFAGVTALVQLTTNGTVSYLPYLEGNTSTNAAATWASVSNLAAAAPPLSTSTSGSSGSSGTSSGSSPGSTGTASGADVGVRIHFGVFVACVLGLVAFVM